MIPGDLDNLGLCAIITVLLQMTFYVVACTCKVDTVTDFAGSGNFVILAVLTFALSGVRGNQTIAHDFLDGCKVVLLYDLGNHVYIASPFSPTTLDRFSSLCW